MIPSRLSWTGHPLVDVGLATLCAFAQHRRPEETNDTDLDAIAEYIERHYFSGALGAYLTCVFPNAGYVNPTVGKDKLASYVASVVRAHRAPADPTTAGLSCAFCGRPAAFFANRQHVPMLTGEGVANFFPAARTALPVDGTCLLALQALPLGSRRAEGRLLCVHADDPELTLAFARRYLKDNQAYLAVYETTGAFPSEDDGTLRRARAMPDKKKGAKFPDAKGPRSMVLDDLAEIYRERKERELPASSATAYLLSNSGQGPSLDAFHIPCNLVRFLSRVNRAETGQAWTRLVARAWRPLDAAEAESQEAAAPEKKRHKKREKPRPGGAGLSRNLLHDDMARLFAGGEADWRGAARFVRRHLVSMRAAKYAAALAGEAPESGHQVAARASWALTELFLTEVLGMDKRRIEAIKTLADRLAEHIAAQNDKKLFQELVYARKAWEFRGAIARAQRREAQDRGALLVTLEQFVDALVADDTLGRFDWTLSRDLISVRLVEALHAKKWFEDKPELLTEPEGAAEEPEKEVA